MATGVTTVGCIIAVATANHSDTSYAFTELVDLFETPSYLSFFALSMCGLLAAANLITRLETDPLWDSYKHKYLPVLYPLIGGTAGSFSVTFAKAFVELVKTTIHGTNEFLAPGPYIVTVFLVGFSVMQVHFLNRGLQNYPALTVIPVYQTCWILGCAAGGVVYFKEFQGFALKDALLFSLGLFITLLGVVLLSRKSMDDGEDGFDPMGEDEADLWLQSRRSLKKGVVHARGAQRSDGPVFRDTDRLIENPSSRG